MEIIAKIIVADIETTGKGTRSDLIVEIGIVVLDLKTGEIDIIMDSLIKENEFNEKHRESWIFNNSSIKYEDVLIADNLNHIISKLNEIFKDLKATSFNKEFDLTFLRNKGVQIPFEFPCIMKKSQKFINEESAGTKSKYPSLKEAWEFIFPDDPPQQFHRAKNDAEMAAKILYKLYSNGKFNEISFSENLESIYDEIVSLPLKGDRIRKQFVHGCINEDEAIIYVNKIFPLHYAKVRETLKANDLLPKGCANIGILDIGCGPFTFTLGILDELFFNSQQYGGGAYNINILGIDFSEYSLNLGKKMVNKWIEKNTNNGWQFEVSSDFDNNNFDDFESHVDNWISDDFHYIFFGYSASMSSGSKNLESILSKFSKYSEKIHIIGIIIEPKKFSHGIDINELMNKFDDFTFDIRQYDIHCKKPKNMSSKYNMIFSAFEAIILDNKDQNIIKIVQNLRDKLFSNDDLILLFNKTKRWLLGEQLNDLVGILLYENDINLMRNNLLFHVQRLLKKRYYKYKIQKGLNPETHRDISFIPIYIIFLNIMILELMGKKLDLTLNKSVYGSRLCKEDRFDKIYEYFTIGYSSFSNFEFESDPEQTMQLCKADIQSFYDTIDHNYLKNQLISDLLLIGESCSFSDLFIKLLGNESGIPIGLPISPLLANLFLKKFDERVCTNSLVHAYGRYMDDLKFLLETPLESSTEKEEFKNYIKSELACCKLELKENKLEFCESESQVIFYRYNTEFENFTNRYFELLRPIKLGLAIFLDNIIEENKFDFSQIRFFSKQYISTFNSIGIKMRLESLERYLIMIYHNLKKQEFKDNIKQEFNDSSLKLIIPMELWENEWDLTIKNFIKTNENWIKQCRDFSDLMYRRLNRELIIWKELIELSKKLDNIEDNVEYNEVYKKLESKLKEPRFLLSSRLIKYLLFRLTRFINEDFNKNDNKSLDIILELYRLYFPVKLIGLICINYGNIENIIELLEKSIESSYRTERHLLRRIYPNDIAFLINLLERHYDDHKKELDMKWDQLEEKIRSILNHRPFEEQLAATKFLIKLNLIQKFEYSEWEYWILNSNNLYSFKNLLICAALHPNSPNNIPNKFKHKILRFYYKDEAIISATMRIWSKIKTNEFKYSPYDPLFEILDIPYEIDLDYELRSLFEWEDGFVGNEFY